MDEELNEDTLPKLPKLRKLKRHNSISISNLPYFRSISDGSYTSTNQNSRGSCSFSKY